ncbi:hypothetical protein [Nostoc cycadae]|uniref:Cytochrome bd-type quinol oxidase, subunit 1 n=1 Tax=Nostoc cycadae WK-1 TaxID=1861711 RepID=A0A2H6LL42_9NOSO|nr:hypothetical protein [Nostoc cycadae]GBE93937.1 cytochrome bd-type quinol oxidase, subunit 1 [Nostoc cycadae WK-1]
MGKAVRDDLHGLEISQKELQQLTNLPVKYQLVLITNPLKEFSKQLIYKMKGSEGATVVFISFSIFVFSYLIFDIIIKLFANWLTMPSWILLLIVCFAGSATIQIIFYLLWRNIRKILKENMTNSLEILLEDVDRYNAVIKAIDINDQIEAAGNPEVSIQKREKVIAALQLTRADLVRALKTERILRENQNFIISNTELFANNLATLTTMQVTEKATEHGKLLNEALQIALDVQYEMKRLQSPG